MTHHENQPLYQKTQIAKSFSKAATHYDLAAHLQKQVGFCLLDKLQSTAHTPKLILDAGAGTGYFADQIANLFPDARVMGVDIAFGMMSFAAEHYPHNRLTYLVGDIDHLPFKTASMDCIFSNLVLQWSPHLLSTLKSIKRVIKPTGYLYFSILLQGTLFELEEAWKKVDTHSHVHPFPSQSSVLESLQKAGYQIIETQTETKTLYYSSILDFFRNLKQIGAHNLQTHRAKGLSPKKTLDRLSHAFQAFHSPNNSPLFPATYKIMYGIAQ